MRGLINGLDLAERRRTKEKARARQMYGIVQPDGLLQPDHHGHSSLCEVPNTGH